MTYSEQYPALYKGLAQIPIKYLKKNLLPKLIADDTIIIYSGYILDKHYTAY